MYNRVSLLLSLALSLTFACDEGATRVADFGAAETNVDVTGTVAIDGEQPRGVYVTYDTAELYAAYPEQAAALAAEAPVDDGTGVIAHAAWIFYMNRDGGTFTPGINDSRNNRSSVPNQTSTLSPFGGSDTDWQEIMTCVREQFAAYDVEITDVDPGQVPHIESVVAGTPGQLGFPGNVGGVSPFTSDCSTIQNSIVYTFANLFVGNNRLTCEIVAQEVAHSFGLDHQLYCEDPMTYLSGCGNKSFQDLATQCGEDQPRTCACGDATQNSVQLLSQRVGIGDAVLPEVAITSPAAGATVQPGFTVTVDATDDVGISEVSLLIDGNLVETKTAAPFTFTTDATLALGSHTIETIAKDAKNEATDSIQVNVGDGDDGDDGGGGGGGGVDGTGSGSLTGGCSTSGSSGGAGLLMLLGATLLLRRRRD